MFDGSTLGCDGRRLAASDPPRMLSAHAPLRGFSVSAWNHAPLARRTAEKAGSAGRAAPHSLSGVAQTPRVYPDAKGPRSLSDHDGAGPLGGHPHGRRTGTPATACAPTL